MLPNNAERADRAIKAVHLHASLIGQKFCENNPLSHDGSYTCVKDLLTDLMHACDKMSLDFDELLMGAGVNYESDIDDEEDAKGES